VKGSRNQGDLKKYSFKGKKTSPVSGRGKSENGEKRGAQGKIFKGGRERDKDGKKEDLFRSGEILEGPGGKLK